MSITTLGYALLTLLVRKPLSGYDLARAMKNPIGFFWQARHSQIYPELARLEELGLVTAETIAQRDRPDKKLYTITLDGQAVLAQWITEPAKPASERNELLLKTYSLWLADPEKAIKLFQDQKELHQQQLAQYEQILTEYPQATPLSPDSPDFGSYATLLRGLSYERGYITWCHWILTQLESYVDDKRSQNEPPHEHKYSD
ncbi:PadR family transcriptional regulator [Ktedonosporobacter rubrisoli]|uniref:PadR family transcriptional regulator n=1 Tax=Ktedonosporobacter rubrisoli TaxID=2509675 RepID=A0A4P6JRZ2_KTERU|nr:PadR family transcriptional regulator [Ktedonosporobacter rubrisoli]QBD78095.1 PadR family transcriptional regulator [Ktedonosporobacter rubrisoli]